MSLPNVMDADFNGPGSELYRAEVFPELFPHQKPMLLENWSQDDLEMYVGGCFTPGYEHRHFRQRYVLGLEGEHV
ncbi:hypothetical protein SEA_SHAM4_52 [Mycobacterium phage Sham4]|uniref:hypothetical protein n=1 Tax=Mycobacterium phage Mulciber TaxID=1805459 RepID=UPI00078B491D|nr:hypothetical protein BJD74_gp56 [Mycobacterium phage Mulciber]AQT28185.1 hypothetical protein SEA_JABITH_53 [Mycobacterium phage Jabith]ASR86689.1 hypothetical protein SEA_ET2BRUTUS_51 [Mycobacterium phage Et2Brutus]AXC33412.1 hypothetical protein SEA_EBONY_52 [Mycobacterium phage Ebony]AXC33512.1 hypothetical protein SEA_JOSELITO_53 [Mycobacterium phage Joselito]AXH50732.1 hypothetical protein SEA_SNAPE_52 [Mycobacterium phage Snape]QBI97883.1 hypothetical protein SEA_ORANGE_52 [Mycobacte